MMEYSKKIKRLLREWAAKSYERELEREFTKLEHSFSDWRNGKISTLELRNCIHQAETQFLKELDKKYNHGMNDFNVAYAIVTDLLDQKEIPTELLDALEKQLSFYQSLKNAGDLRLPGE